MGIVTDFDQMALDAARTLRGQLLKMLSIAGPMGCNERLLLTSLEGLGYTAMRADIRRHLDYLAQSGLIEIVDRDRETWAAKILPAGIDLVEGAVKPPPGVARI